MHYSMLMQGSPSNGMFEWINPYKYRNPYITSMNILFRPNQVMFNNVDTINVVTNSGGEEVTVSPGYYTLSEIIAILNAMTNTSFSISTMAQVMDVFGSSLHTLSISLMHRIYEKSLD